MSETTDTIRDHLYPFDATGQKPSNLIENEKHVLQTPPLGDYHFIIPRLAPFFSQSLKIEVVETGKTLVRGVDYWVCHHYIGASRALARPVYGSIQFFDRELVGVIQITYQTLGGQYTLDEKRIAEILDARNRNPRVITWEEVAEVPEVFPPIDHDWNLQDMVGMSEVKDAIDGVAGQVGERGDIATAFDQHKKNDENPHGTTKEHVGLAKVANLSVATRKQALDGETNEAYMTPLRTQQSLEGYTYSRQDLDTRLANLANRLAALEES